MHEIDGYIVPKLPDEDKLQKNETRDQILIGETLYKIKGPKDDRFVTTEILDRCGVDYRPQNFKNLPAEVQTRIEELD